MINPKNMPGAEVTIVGYAAANGEKKTFGNGGSVAEVGILVNQGFKGQNGWTDLPPARYTISAGGDYMDPILAIKSGDKVRIDGGRLQTREFDRKQGGTGLALDVRYGEVTILESKAERSSSAPAADEDEF